jgi:hypothetical protein
VTAVAVHYTSAAAGTEKAWSCRLSQPSRVLLRRALSAPPTHLYCSATFGLLSTAVLSLMPTSSWIIACEKATTQQSSAVQVVRLPEV